MSITESKNSYERIRKAIRDVADFPKPGIIFKDITPVLSDPQLLRLAVNAMVERHTASRIDKVVAIDARGFIFGGAVAYNLGCGFIPIRKKGKLPYKTIELAYELEYGQNVLSIHEDAITKGTKVLIVDDLLATGGTTAAAIQLIEKLGGQVVEIDFLIELGFLEGRKKIGNYPIFSIVTY